MLNEYEISDTNKNREITSFALNMLTGDGTLAVIEPATESCARRLADLHWYYKSGEAGMRVTALGPCAYPWRRYPGSSRRCSCWSFVCEPWHKPGMIAVLESYGSRRKNEVKFSYLLLRRDGYNRYHHLKNPDGHRKNGFIMLSRLSGHQGQTVNVLGIAIHICNLGNARVIDICDGTAGAFNYCHLEVRPGVSGPAGEVLAGVKHGDFLELRNVELRPGSRGSNFTLLVTGRTVARLRPVRREEVRELFDEYNQKQIY